MNKLFGHYKERKRSASMELGINAIVIIVLAMLILSLGIGFIRNLITKGSQNFGSAIDNAELENPADAANPVTIDKTVQVKAGKTAKIKIGFYNINSGALTIAPMLDAECEKNFNLSSGVQTVPQGEARGYVAVLTADTGLTGTHVCTVEFQDTSTPPVSIASKQFFIDIVG